MESMLLTRRQSAVRSTRLVKVESWPQAKQQRTPTAGADLDAVAQSELPASGFGKIVPR